VEGRELAGQLNAQFFEVCAKTGAGIDELFEAIADGASARVSPRNRSPEPKRDKPMKESHRDDFELASRVGRGGQAVVELWRHKRTGELLAAKVFDDPAAGDSERISDEARLLMSLVHPSIVQGYAIFLPRRVG
jgi:serine/threonine protein kinase